MPGMPRQGSLRRPIGEYLAPGINLALGSGYAGGNLIHGEVQNSGVLAGHVVLFGIVRSPLAHSLADSKAVDADPGSDHLAVFVEQLVVRRDNGDAGLLALVNSDLGQLLIGYADQDAGNALSDGVVERLQVGVGIHFGVDEHEVLRAHLDAFLFCSFTLTDEPLLVASLVDTGNDDILSGSGGLRAGLGRSRSGRGRRNGFRSARGLRGLRAATEQAHCEHGCENQ